MLVAPAPSNKRRADEVVREAWPLPNRASAMAKRGKVSISHTLVDGIGEAGEMGAARLAKALQSGAFGTDPITAALGWVRSAARCAPTPRSNHSNLQKAYKQSVVVLEHADCFQELLLRGHITTSRVQVCDTGATYTVEGRVVSDDEDSDLDDDHNIEPLRWPGYQAEIASTIQHRPDTVPPDERALIANVLWDPELPACRAKRRSIEHLHLVRPWDQLLKPAAPAPGSRRGTISFPLRPAYIPTESDVQHVREAQNLHAHSVIHVIGAAGAAALGFDRLSPQRELMRWELQLNSHMMNLEYGLGRKDDGLIHVRLKQVPSVRMHDVAEYYYRVWRTMSTPAAQRHYMAKSVTKAKRRERAAREALTTTIRAPMRPPEYVQAPAAPPARPSVNMFTLSMQQRMQLSAALQQRQPAAAAAAAAAPASVAAPSAGNGQSGSQGKPPAPSGRQQEPAQQGSGLDNGESRPALIMRAGIDAGHAARASAGFGAAGASNLAADDTAAGAEPAPDVMGASAAV